MRVVVQRVRSAEIAIDGQRAAAIGPGLLALVGFGAKGCDSAGLARMAERLIRVRLFDDEQGRLGRSVSDIGGEILLVSQVTLSASLEKGHRPSFHTAAPAEEARKLFEAFASEVRKRYEKTSLGTFQASMLVSLVNDGPVTVILE